jgi:hypothetical protein
MVRKWEWFTTSGQSIWSNQRYYFSDCKRVLSHDKVASSKIVMQFPSEYQFRVLSKDFETLHGISHIPILAPLIGGED